MTTYLENYLASISTLPAEIRRNFQLIRDLDDRTQDTLSKAERIISQYRGSGKQTLEEFLTPAELKELRDELTDATRLGQEKLDIASQSYEVVDKHIRRLDQDLKKFEAELDKDRTLQEALQEQTLRSLGGRSSAAAAIRKRPRDEVDSTGPNKRKAQGTLFSAGQLQVSHAAMDDSSDLPVDPNEPVYCTCKRVSFGEMIGCDNDKCPVEWYHFECVGLKEKPKGKWYCSLCAPKFK